jgi:hypothetical protein
VVPTSNTERPEEVWPGGAPQVGQRAELSRKVKPEYIELFSEVSGDYNPVHYDEAVACGCRILRRGWSCGVSVFVDESVAAGRSDDV